MQAAQTIRDTDHTAKLALSLGDRLQDCARGVVPGNAADGPTAKRARAAEENIFPIGLDTPGADIFFPGRKRPRRRVLENIAAIHT